MKNKFSLEWLIKEYENGEQLKYIYFWGNTAKENQISKSCFSQWYDSSFTVKDVTYTTAEHWMMAQKALLFNDREIFEKIIRCIKPSEAKDLGRAIKNFNEELWLNERYQIVVNGNIHKFNQNRELGEFLLSTKNRILVEASPVDKIWGIGLAQDSKDIDNLYNWRGQNLLGFALMEARDFLSVNGFFNELTDAIIPSWERYDQDPLSMFWRMGIGEEYTGKMVRYFEALSDTEKTIYKLYNPEPNNWKGFYD